MEVGFFRAGFMYLFYCKLVLSLFLGDYELKDALIFNFDSIIGKVVLLVGVKLS